ncbi:hypothetical protein Ddc_11172 [Ditylenchus destructor]|nr:hypothetical protein Ddc_11172 [Ditylenchus destructor]
MKLYIFVLFFYFAIANARREEAEEAENSLGKTLAFSKDAAPSQYRIKPTSGSGSTVLKVVDDVAKTWAVRVDKPHVGHQYNHINVNKAVSGLKDPHTPIPNAALTLAKGVNQVAKVIEKVEPVMQAVVIANDAYQLVDAAYSDFKYSRCPRRTIRKAGAVGGSYVGLYAGAKAGGSVGAGIGGMVGGLFGGIGSVPAGAFVGEGVGDAVGDEFCR